MLLILWLKPLGSHFFGVIRHEITLNLFLSLISLLKILRTHFSSSHRLGAFKIYSHNAPYLYQLKIFMDSTELYLIGFLKILPKAQPNLVAPK